MEQKQSMSKKQLLTYLSIVFLVSWSVQFLAIAINGSINAEESRPWLAATMISPALITLLYLKKNIFLRNQIIIKPNIQVIKMILIAVIIPIMIGLSIILILQSFDLGQSDWLAFENTNVTIAEGPWILGVNKQNLIYFTLNIFITGTVFALLNGIIASGEEFAWRGFLQGQLIEIYGLNRGILILGFIWSMWHLPALLNGYNFSENPILGSLIFFPIQMMSLSVFYGWLTIKCKSFIPAAISHGALNSIQEAIILIQHYKYL